MMKPISDDDDTTCPACGSDSLLYEVVNPECIEFKCIDCDNNWYEEN